MEITRYIEIKAVKLDNNTLIPIWEHQLNHKNR